MPFTIARDGYRVTSTCTSCGAHRTERTDQSLTRWQRNHRCPVRRMPR